MIKVIEINKKYIKEYGGIKQAIKKGYYRLWNDNDVKLAFSFGNGTKKDLDRYIEDNYKNIKFIDLTLKSNKHLLKYIPIS